MLNAAGLGAGFVLINCAMIKSARRSKAIVAWNDARRESFDGQSSARRARAVSERELLLFCQSL